MWIMLGIAAAAAIIFMHLFFDVAKRYREIKINIDRNGNIVVDEESITKVLDAAEQKADGKFILGIIKINS